MTEDVVIDLTQDMIKMLIMLGGPILIAGLIVGLIISVLQTITQINEATLTFLPKMAIMFLLIIVLGPWMLDLIVNYTTELYEQIPLLVRN